MMGSRRGRWGIVWQIDWKAWTGKQHWQAGKVAAHRVKKMEWKGRLDVRKQLSSGVFFPLFFFFLNRLTIFGRLDLGALVLPNNSGWWWTDNITDYVSILTLDELLRVGSTLERDLFCGGMDILHIFICINTESDICKGENLHIFNFSGSLWCLYYTYQSFQ